MRVIFLVFLFSCKVNVSPPQELNPRDIDSLDKIWSDKIFKLDIKEVSSAPGKNGETHIGYFLNFIDSTGYNRYEFLFSPIDSFFILKFRVNDSVYHKTKYKIKWEGDFKGDSLKLTFNTYNLNHKYLVIDSNSIPSKDRYLYKSLIEATNKGYLIDEGYKLNIQFK